MIKFETKRFIFLSIFILLLSGCAGIGKRWKALISGEDPAKEAPRSRATGSSFSQQNNMIPSTHRNYRRTKKKDLEDDAHLEGRSGSLWVMEGQGAYLFSQNVVRMIGDPIGVNIEGDPRDQLSSKASVISTLLTQLEERRRRAMGRGPANEKGKKDEPVKEEQSKTEANSLANPTSVGQPGAPTEADKNFSVKTVPTRVVERLVDGNYRVRGTQPFMIGQREYKVIVSGIVRAEDFNDQGISSTQLLDSSFDIVSSKGSETR